MFTAVHNRPDDPRPELNTTPLIDVMLVLLTILLLTVPIMTHSIQLNTAAGPPRNAGAPPIAEIEIEFDGAIYWNHHAVPLAESAPRTHELMAASDKAELHLRVSRLAQYDIVAQVLAEAQRNGARRIQFLGNERFL